MELYVTLMNETDNSLHVHARVCHADMAEALKRAVARAARMQELLDAQNRTRQLRNETLLPTYYLVTDAFGHVHWPEKHRC